MVTTSICISEILKTTPPFNRLSTATLNRLTQKSQLLRYQMGQQIALKESIPAQIAILYQGQARLIGYASESSLPSTLELLKPGAIIGWVSLLRSVPCETVIASTDAVCLLIPALTFQNLIQHSSDFTN
ncbi:MAG: cyclic nucleotide-binding domain-containing protein, partial [Cyanobacteria bacterium J06641_2]